MPPLRERKAALPNLIKYFILKNKESQGKDIVDVEPAALYALTKYPYPGNIRELENILEHAIVLSEGGIIRFEDLPENVQNVSREATVAIPHIKREADSETEESAEQNAATESIDYGTVVFNAPISPIAIAHESSPATPTVAAPAAAPVEENDDLITLEEMERRYILRALSVCKNNKTLVCSKLGISRATLWRKLKDLKIEMNGED